MYDDSRRVMYFGEALVEDEQTHELRPFKGWLPVPGPTALQVAENTRKTLERLRRQVIGVSRRLEPTGGARRAHARAEEERTGGRWTRKAEFKPLGERKRRLLERRLVKVKRQLTAENTHMHALLGDAG